MGINKTNWPFFLIFFFSFFSFQTTVFIIIICILLVSVFNSPTSFLCILCVAHESLTTEVWESHVMASRLAIPTYFLSCRFRHRVHV